MKLMYKYQCLICGANLDPGEHCDCRDEHEQKLRKRLSLNHKMNELLEDTEWKQEELKICC